jgi:hypothetical protein
MSSARRPTKRPFRRFGGIDKTEEPPDSDRSRHPCDLNIRQRRSARSSRENPLHGFGHQDFTRPGAIGEAGREIHRASGDRVLAERQTSGPSRNDLAARDADMRLQLSARLRSCARSVKELCMSASKEAKPRRTSR